MTEFICYRILNLQLWNVFFHIFEYQQADSDEVSNPRNQVLRSDEGIVTNELAEEGIRGTVGAVVIDKGNY